MANEEHASVPPPLGHMSHFIHVPNSPVPKFKGTEAHFQTWKKCFWLHIEGVDSFLHTIIEKGPFKHVLSTATPLLNPDGTSRVTLKPADQWTDEEKRLAGLDTRLRSIIISALPENLIPSIISETTAKAMWLNLCVRFEGTEEVLENRKASMLRKYETFFSLPNESLTETYIRFTNLLSNLEGLDVKIPREKVLTKFLDILPMKWLPLVLVVRNNFTLEKHTLSSLYGTFLFHEQNTEERLSAERGARSQSSSTTVAEMSRSSALVSTSDETSSLKRILSELLECKILSVDTEDCEEKNDDDLMAMVAKTFTRFRTRSNRFNRSGPSISAGSKPIDKSFIICFKCGKKGHYMKECSSKSFPHKSPTEESYKEKYEKLVSQLAVQDEPSQLGLIAETKEKDWAYSDSSDDDTEVVNLCLMAIAESDHLTKDHLTNGQWVDITMRKVILLSNTSDSEAKMDLTDSLACDLQFIENQRVDLEKNFQNYATELFSSRSQLKELKEVLFFLKSQEYLNTILTNEIEQLKSET
ncbi:MAG TPA: hypothetical protein VIJ14_01075, partial [Rhabdochlamydiaceae bacterium]